jgi:anti-sigma B factor antagonist
MATPLDLSTRRGDDGIPVLTVAGEIDMSNAGKFREALGRAAPEGGPFVVDLTGVAYLDSAGINALFAHAPRIRLIANALLDPVLTICGLADITSVSEPGDLPGLTG